MSAGRGPLSRRGRKARLVESYFKGRPLWASWQVTRRCSSFCHFCEHRGEAEAEELDLAACRRIASRLGEIGTLVVSLTGGDPFLRADLPEIVGALAERHFPLVTSHGWLVKRPLARALWQSGLEAATIVLEDADPARHDAAVGLGGAHAQAVAALDVLVAERTRPSQQVNVKGRLREVTPAAVEALGRLAAAHGATLSVEPVYPLPRAAAPGAALAPALFALKREQPALRSSRFFLERMDAAFAGGVPGCRAGRSFFNVDHRGRVSKCVEFQGPGDRVGELPGGEVGPLLQALRERNAANTCQACWYSSRGEVEALYTVRGLLGMLPEVLGR